MATTRQVRSNGSGYAASTVTKAPDWHGLVAWDLLLNNLTTGLFLIAALADLMAAETRSSCQHHAPAANGMPLPARGGQP